jgi:phospholipase C
VAPALTLTLLTCALTAGLVAGPATAAPAASAAAGRAVARHGRVRHVIEIMLENHTLDNLFPSLAAPSGAVTPVAAPHNEGDVQGGIHNNRVDELRAMDQTPGQGYLMDRYTDPPFGVSAVTSFGSWAHPNLSYLASSYELAGQNFQPAIGPTRPNLMMAVNGTAHGWYYDRPDPHPAPWYSIFEELATYGHSWGIYVGIPQSYLHGTAWYAMVPPGQAADVRTASDFITALATGHLPAFSFIRPGWGYSEEPREDIGEGDAWLGQLVSAVARSRYWPSTAIFISYDEGGGFWDNLAPPVARGYGTRTPLVIVSPWARHGVFGEPTTNISVLSYLQHLWHMPPLTRLNSLQNNLTGAFDYSQPPLPPPTLPVAPPDTIGFHGRTMERRVRIAHPGGPLRLYLDAETSGLALDQAMTGPLTLTLTPPRGVTVRGFPASTRLVAGRAMVRVTFPAPGYYRITASGPDGSVGWVTVVVLPWHGHPGHGTSGLPRSTM